MLAIVNQIRGMGYDLTDEEVVSKVMRSLSSRFVHVVTSVEEAKDISKLSLDELSGSLQAHEARFNQFSDRHEDRAFVMRGDPSGDRNFMRGRRKIYRGRGRENDSPGDVGYGSQRSGDHR